MKAIAALEGGRCGPTLGPASVPIYAAVTSMRFIRRKPQRPIAEQPDFAILRHVEKLLVSEHEAAMTEFATFRSRPLSAEWLMPLATEPSSAMRRLEAVDRFISG